MQVPATRETLRSELYIAEVRKLLFKKSRSHTAWAEEGGGSDGELAVEALPSCDICPLRETD